jgi:glycosyltransferase involved in cell wall biosynthesis
MASAPLVSCIVPVFNGEQYLREALDSVLRQTYRPLELIVVDDGSTDGTSNLVASYGEQVRYVPQPNAGPATARNRGIAAARGDYIAFLDADDLWHPQKAALQVARFAARSDLDVCLTGVQNFWMPEVQDEAQRYRDHRRGQAVPGYTSVTLMARSRVFETMGVFASDLKHGADAEWFSRIEERGAVIEVLPDVLVSRRLHEANRSRHWAGRSQEEFLRLMKTLVERRRALQKDRPGE